MALTLKVLYVESTHFSQCSSIGGRTAEHHRQEILGLEFDSSGFCKLESHALYLVMDYRNAVLIGANVPERHLKLREGKCGRSAGCWAGLVSRPVPGFSSFMQAPRQTTRHCPGHAGPRSSIGWNCKVEIGKTFLSNSTPFNQGRLWGK